MKVLFLDVDGVLNSDQYRLIYQSPYFTPDPENIDPQAVACLDDFLKSFPDVVVVICSTWKRTFGVKEMKEILRKKGLSQADKIIDATPNLSHTLIKGEEIKAWLELHPEVTYYAALDDGDDLTLIAPRQIKTTMERGLSSKEIKLLKEVFGENS